MKICRFEGCRTIGAPRDWDANLDGACGDIYVTDAVDLQSGMNFMYSIYKPSEADLDALNNGGCIRLGIMGRIHPVFNLVVIGPVRTSVIQPEEVWDMGDPI